jgi:hypothetical protein
MDLPRFAKEAEGKFQQALALLPLETPAPSNESIAEVLSTGFGQGRDRDLAMNTEAMIAVADLYVLLQTGVISDNVGAIEAALVNYNTAEILTLKKSLREIVGIGTESDQQKLTLMKDHAPGILKSLTSDISGLLQTVENEYSNNLIAANLKDSVKLLGAGSVTQSQFAEIQQAFQGLIDSSGVRKFKGRVVDTMQTWFDGFLKEQNIKFSQKTKEYLFQVLITINFNKDLVRRNSKKTNALAHLFVLLLDHADTRALKTPVVDRIAREIVRWSKVHPEYRPVLAAVLTHEDPPSDKRNPLSNGEDVVQAVGQDLVAAVQKRDLPAFSAVLKKIMHLPAPATGDVYQRAFAVRLEISILLDELQEASVEDIDWDKINQILADPAQITAQEMLSWEEIRVGLTSTFKANAADFDKAIALSILGDDEFWYADEIRSVMQSKIWWSAVALALNVHNESVVIGEKEYKFKVRINHPRIGSEGEVTDLPTLLLDLVDATGTVFEEVLRLRVTQQGGVDLFDKTEALAVDEGEGKRALIMGSLSNILSRQAQSDLRVLSRADDVDYLFLVQSLMEAIKRKLQSNKGADERFMALPTGGIDFVQANLSLQIKRDGAGVPLPVNQQNLANMRIEGLVPVLLAIEPFGKVLSLSETTPVR